MISLKNTILHESILGSVGSGREGLKDKIKQWLVSHNIKDYVLNDNLTVVFTGAVVNLMEPIPDYITVTRAKSVFVQGSVDILNNLPNVIGCLLIDDCEIKDFTDISDINILRLCISNCDIKSLKGIPSPQDRLYIGNNKQQFSKKELKKAGITTKPNDIYNIGCTSIYGGVVLGDNDSQHISEEFEKLKEMYSKLLPEMKSFNYSCRKGSPTVYFTIDFLSKEEHPNYISDNSIFLSFSYQLEGSILEYKNSGCLELTQKDREGRYKYYALKSFTDPYKDKGGKKFRRTRLYIFTAKEIFEKTKDWIRAVVDAALEDQGGVLKRR